MMNKATAATYWETKVVIPYSIKKYAYTFNDGSERMRRKGIVFILTIRRYRRR